MTNDHDEVNITSTENAVFKLLDKGLSQKMVAEEIKKPENTVHSHVKNVFRKLSVHNLTSALHKLRQKGKI